MKRALYQTRLPIFAAIFLIFFGCTNRSRFSINSNKNDFCKSFGVCPYINEQMKANFVPGLSIAIIHDEKIAFSKGFGIKAKGSIEPVDEQTLFQACSISKPFAALVAMEQIKAGKLLLDTDVNNYLKTWKVPENDFTKKHFVTVKTILNHTAGFRPGRGYDFTLNDKIPSLKEILEGKYNDGTPTLKGAVTVEFVPGSKYQYSTTGYAVLEQILQDVTSSSFADLGNQLLNKIGMHHSTFLQPLPKPLFAHAAHAHDEHGNAYAEDWYVIPEVAAAGLWTTASDLALAILEIQKSIKQKKDSALDPLIIKEMLVPYYNDFGLGIKTGGKGKNQWFSHGGDNKGYKAIFVGYANIGEGLVVLTNSDHGFTLALEIFRSVAQTLNWPDFENIKF